MSRKQIGFTIVELVIVIVIIGVIAAITFVGSSKIFADSRDASRNTTAVLISEALEDYYDKNGEYPSVQSLVNDVSGNTGVVVAERLGLHPDNLLTPNIAVGVTNALTRDAPTPQNDLMTYRAAPATSTCQTDINGWCEHFTLEYIEESGSTVTIEGRRS